MNRLVKWFRPLVDKRGVERELDEELRFHVEMETAQGVGRGLPAAEARRLALARFGGVEKVKEEVREEAPSRWVEELGQDLRYGLRALRRSPGYAAAVVLTLGLGIGANTAVFSVVDGVLLRPLPYDRDGRLVLVRQQAPAAGLDDLRMSVAEVADYRARTRSFDGLVEYHNMWFNLLGRGEPQHVQTGVVSANFFDVLGVRPILGRTFEPADERAGAEAVLVLSHRFWREQEGGDPAIVGRTFEMNDRIHTVVGVLPPIPQYPEENDVYMPTSACPFRSKPETIANRGARGYLVFGRLRPGTTVERASVDSAHVAAGLVAEYPQDYPAGVGFTATVQPLREELVQSARPTLLILLATVALMLLIVCANVANLTLARLVRREGELAVRSALGAGRGRLVRQLLTESAVLALAGGALGLAFAGATLRLLVAFASRFTPRAAEASIDGRVLLFTLTVSLLTGLVIGILPALSRRGAAEGLREASGRVASGGRGQRLLIASQLAASFVLLVGAGLLLRSFSELQRVDPGFDTAHVLTASIDLDWTRYHAPEQMRAFGETLLRSAQALPGVQLASVASTFPLNSNGPATLTVEIEGRPAPPGQPAPQIDYRAASDGYFETLRVPLLRGRTFEPGDHATALPVAVVNQSMARHLWPDGDPLGRRITMDGGQTWRTIVGIVGDARQYGLDRVAGDEVYVPLAQRPYLSLSLLLRTAADPVAMTRTVRDMVHGLDPQQPIFHVATLEDLRTESLASPRLTAVLVGIFAALALVVTATGVAGVIAFSVNQRTHEFGIRMALGAKRSRVLWMVLRQATTMVLIAIPLGVIVALAGHRLVAGLLYGVQPTDPLTYLGVSLLLALVATLACLVPARRATAVDPGAALRSA